MEKIKKYEKQNWKICILGAENIINYIHCFFITFFVGCFRYGIGFLADACRFVHAQYSDVDFTGSPYNFLETWNSGRRGVYFGWSSIYFYDNNECWWLAVGVGLERSNFWNGIYNRRIVYCRLDNKKKISKINLWNIKKSAIGENSGYIWQNLDLLLYFISKKWFLI